MKVKRIPGFTLSSFHPDSRPNFANSSKVLSLPLNSANIWYHNSISIQVRNSNIHTLRSKAVKKLSPRFASNGYGAFWRENLSKHASSQVYRARDSKITSLEDGPAASRRCARMMWASLSGQSCRMTRRK